jgi:hypothetical protein
VVWKAPLLNLDVSAVSGRLTKRPEEHRDNALDSWDSARFQALFVALGFSRVDGESRLSHPPQLSHSLRSGTMSHTVGQLLENRVSHWRRS